MEKKLLSIILLIVMLFTFVSCGKPSDPNIIGDISGESTNSVSEKPTSTPEENPELPNQNINLEEGGPLTLEPVGSYYRETSLDTRTKLAFDEIYSAIQNFQPEVALSKSGITLEEMKKIISIIYLDCPEIFQVENEYEYELNEAGNVSKIFFVYVMKVEDFNEYNDKLSLYAVNNISTYRQSNEYEFSKSIYEVLKRNNYAREREVDYYSGNALNTAFMPILSNTGNSMGISKAYCYLLRKLGMQTTVRVGELNSNELSKFGFNVPQYHEIDYANLVTIEENPETNRMKMKMDYSSLYVWNIVKINDKWYNIDIVYDNLLQSITNSDNIYDELLLFAFVPDYLISQSRIFYINEDILGITPSCESIIFQEMYREKKLWLSYNQNQVPILINKFIEKMYSGKLRKDIIQFENEETYKSFLASFDSIMEQYNKNNTYVIEKYEIMTFDSALTVIIYDVLYN